MTSILRSATTLSTALVALCCTLVGCTDLGDSTAVPGSGDDGSALDGTVSDDGQGSSAEGASFDDASEASVDGSQGVSSPTDEASQTETATGNDAEAGSSEEPPAPEEAGAEGGVDAGADVVMTGADAQDTAAPEMLDATTSEAGSDAGPEAGFDAMADVVADGETETGTTDAGADASSLVPCTVVGQTGCVECDQTAAGNGVCTDTEAIVVSWDIAKGYVSGNVPDPVASCYECLVSSECIDSTLTHLARKDCETAPAGSVGAGAQATETNVQACLNTLACLFGATDMSFVSCANDPSPGDGISNCYCGSSFPNVTSCNGAPALSSSGGVNGKCAQVILDGLGDTSSTAPSTVLKQITTPTLASGLADSIFKCAGSNADTPDCPQCFQ